MSYIDKNSNIVISARMTDEGRRLLSLGLLTFDSYRLGDSNIDYTTLGSNYNISYENIIRAKAENPDIKTPIPPTPNATNNYVTIPTLSPVILQTLINAPKVGFFDYGSGTTVQYTAYTDNVCHVLQADSIIYLSANTSGGTTLFVNQAPTYGSNTYEPQIGDLMMVKMSNNLLGSTQSKGVVELTTPVPYLWYQVQGVSGTLAGNNLQVQIDRNFANFPGYVGSNYCWTTFYPLGTGTTIQGSKPNSLFSSGGFFSGGCVWNMNNVWSYPIPGVDSGVYETYDKYGSETYIGSKEYFGYTSEIPLTLTANTPCSIIPSISIIHYTNQETCENQSEQKYGQKLYIDTTVPASPKLIMPTLMWHRNYSATTIGYIFSGSGATQYVTLSGVNTTVYYTPLVDGTGLQVGRIFPELHMFTIHDQELVAAMSYKSNRNWTLPTVNLGVQASTNGVINGTENLYVTYLLASNTGYTTGLHCQNIECINFANAGCDPLLSQNVTLQLPVGEFPYMTSGGTGTGWYADTFYILAQKQPIGTYPDPTQWVLMDYTSNITNHTLGNRIDPINLQSTTFTITNTDYSNGSTYNLDNFINIPQIAETNYLQFGDERFFFGNVEATGVTNKYRTKFVFTVPPTQFNTSTNPTWPNSNQKVRINEVGIYDVNKKLVAVGKMNNPIQKVANATIIIEVSFDL